MKAAVIGLTVGWCTIAAFSDLSCGSVVMYDNSGGEFKWLMGIDYPGDQEDPGNFLDITRPASEQTGARVAGTFGQWYKPNETGDTPAWRRLRGEANAEVAESDEPVVLPWIYHPLYTFVVREYSPGDSIASTARWVEDSPYFFHIPFSDSLSEGTPAISSLAYLGVRIKVAGHWHYGWILFADYEVPLRWAYETEPDLPIEVPVPACPAGVVTLAGSCMLQRRFRR